MAIDVQETKKRILEATIAVFRDKGLKFTMDDIAKKINISKKTIYTVFQDKESLFLAMVDHCFDSIKESEEALIGDPTLTTREKLHRVLGVLPEGYKDLEFTHLYVLKEKYPRIYKQVELRLESGWERTIELIEQGVEEGVFRPVHVSVFKVMLEATLEQFFQREVLVKNRISYRDALDEVVDILMDGISVHEK